MSERGTAHSVADSIRLQSKMKARVLNAMKTANLAGRRRAFNRSDYGSTAGYVRATPFAARIDEARELLLAAYFQFAQL